MADNKENKGSNEDTQLLPRFEEPLDRVKELAEKANKIKVTGPVNGRKLWNK